MDKRKLEKFRLIDKALYFPEKKILVLADLHIGYEEYLNEKGIFAPRTQFKEILKDLEKVFQEIKKIRKKEDNGKEKLDEIRKFDNNRKEKLNKIIVLGDLKHEFGKISSQEWYEVKKVLDFFKEKSKKVILIKGNHDTILEPIAKRKELEIRDYYIEREICFLHGNKLFPKCLDKKIKMLAIGHRHPAVLLSDKYKREKYKCFLAGKWKSKEIIILPSFFPFIEGSDIANYEENRLFISEKILRNFNVFIVGEKVYGFGKLRRII